MHPPHFTLMRSTRLIPEMGFLSSLLSVYFRWIRQCVDASGSHCAFSDLELKMLRVAPGSRARTPERRGAFCTPPRLSRQPTSPGRPRHPCPHPTPHLSLGFDLTVLGVSGVGVGRELIPHEGCYPAKRASSPPLLGALCVPAPNPRFRSQTYELSSSDPSGTEWHTFLLRLGVLLTWRKLKGR